LREREDDLPLNTIIIIIIIIGNVNFLVDVGYIGPQSVKKGFGK
jgi:hypothetical protein